MRTVIQCPLCNWEMEEPDAERFLGPVPMYQPGRPPTSPCPPAEWLNRLVRDALVSRARYIELTVQGHVVRHWAFRQALFAAAKDLAKGLAVYPS